MHDTPLLRLCGDLVKSSDLRNQFDADPYKVMTDPTYGYELTEEAMEAFYTMYSTPPGTASGTWRAVFDYIWENEIKLLEVEMDARPSDPDCHEPESYPNPMPKLWTFSPAQAPAGSTDVKVKLKGQGLWKRTEVYLVSERGRYAVCAGTPVGTYRCSVLEDKFDLSGVPRGLYKVMMRNATRAPYTRDHMHGDDFQVT